MPKNVEIEAKIVLSPKEANIVRNHLKRLHARFDGLEWERNELFDFPDWRLEKQGKLLRVRGWRRGKKTGTVLTIKQRKVASSFRRDEHNISIDTSTHYQRQKQQFAFDDAKELGFALRDLGLKTVWVYEKRREDWRIGKTMITIDFLPKMGWFVEIEAPNEKTIYETAKKLGIKTPRLLASSYMEVAYKRFGKKLPNLVFKRRI
jgi:adenylate cyclase class IV